MRHDDDVPVPSGNLGKQAPPPAALEVLLARRQHLGPRIEPIDIRRPGLHQMVGHHDHWLLGQAQALALHGPGDAGKGLARAHHMIQQQDLFDDAAPHRVLLRAPHADDLIRHLARKLQVRPVMLPVDPGIKLLVEQGRQPLPPFAVGEDPVGKLHGDLVHLQLRQFGLRLVQMELALVVGIAQPHGPAVEHGRQQLRRRGPRAARRIGHSPLVPVQPLLAAVKADLEGIGDAVIGHPRLAAGQMGKERLPDIGRNPVGADLGRHLLRRPQGRLHLLQGRDVGRQSRRPRRLQLAPHLAGQIGVPRLQPLALGVEEHQGLVALGQLLLRLSLHHPQQGGDALQIHPAGLRQGHRQGVGHRLRPLRRLVGHDHPPEQDLRRTRRGRPRLLAHPLGPLRADAVLVAQLQGQHQGAVGHLAHQGRRLALVDQAVLGAIRLIGVAQLRPVSFQGAFGRPLGLQHDLLLQQVAQPHQGPQPLIARGAQAQTGRHLRLAGVGLALIDVAHGPADGLLDLVTLLVELFHQLEPAPRLVHQQPGRPGGIGGDGPLHHLHPAAGDLPLQHLGQGAVGVDAHGPRLVAAGRDLQGRRHVREARLGHRDGVVRRLHPVDREPPDRRRQGIDDLHPRPRLQGQLALGAHSPRPLQGAQHHLRIGRQPGPHRQGFAAQRVRHLGRPGPGDLFLVVGQGFQFLRGKLGVGLGPLRLRRAFTGLEARPLLPRALAEHQDIRHHLGQSVTLERGIRQADGADELRVRRHRQPCRRVLGIEQEVGHHPDIEPVLAQVVQVREDELIVQGKAIDLRLVLPAYPGPGIGRVANGQIETVAGDRQFVGWRVDRRRLGIEGRQDARRHAIHLHRHRARVAAQARRHQAEEVTHPRRRLQHQPATEAQPLRQGPHAVHHRLAGVMGILGGAPRRAVIRAVLAAQQFPQGFASRLPALGPLLGLGVGKGLMDAAPADIARQDRLFLRRGAPLLRRQGLDDADGRDVVVVLADLTALAEGDLIGDGEVARRDRRRGHRHAIDARRAQVALAQGVGGKRGVFRQRGAPAAAARPGPRARAGTGPAARASSPCPTLGGGRGPP